ncbi:hypothetical protein Nepgr_030021 [Nepenthes gracilis]|uniref:Late embryogenesis abundant protein At5g17165-like n=1 Tax=Nepenthes gracilis TaxID=150966 RepID=A0AAD3TFL0_NEPGR|nr:hypothetical protein Nepgr_030021 [Nepenthes gracilis]
MAANSGSRRVVSLGKRFVNNQIWVRDPTLSLSAAAAAAPSRRSVHASVYDKNLEDQVRPTIVPDDVIQPQSDKYWAPNPHTGVFGPDTEHSPAAGSERGFQTSNSTPNGGSESVLEQKAFFRPLEDLDKPPQHP